MQPKNELKGCPFCGGTPKMVKDSGDERNAYADRVSFVCQSCGCSRGACGDTSKRGYADNSTVEQRALSAWNTRVAATIEAELECARGDLKTAMEIAERNVKDAERYRWLRSPSVGPHTINTHLFETVSDDVNPPYRTMKIDAELDRAIDLRMRDKK